MASKEIQVVAFESRAYPFIFVAVPGERGRYLRTDRSVAVAACPHCGSVIGEPCKGLGGRYSGSTHYSRRSGVRHLVGAADDILELDLFERNNEGIQP